MFWEVESRLLATDGLTKENIIIIGKAEVFDVYIKYCTCKRIIYRKLQKRISGNSLRLKKDGSGIQKKTYSRRT